MNYLAHLFLSPDNEEIRVGNFIADSLKGTHWQDYSQGIQKGILLHRAIDSFTDVHEDVKSCILQLRPHFRLYSGVVVDIYFDHYLAANWGAYSNEKLSEFASRQYAIIRKYIDIIPPRAQTLFHYVEKNNWLENYKDISFLERVFAGMAKRTPFTSHMEIAPQKLVENYEFFKRAFDSFFPQLQEEVYRFIQGQNEV